MKPITPLRPTRPMGSQPCEHWPPCPDALAIDRAASRAVVRHPEQGWSLLCNGVVLFDDGGALLPGGRASFPATPHPGTPYPVTPRPSLLTPPVAA